MNAFPFSLQLQIIKVAYKLGQAVRVQESLKWQSETDTLSFIAKFTSISFPCACTLLMSGLKQDNWGYRNQWYEMMSLDMRATTVKTKITTK